MGERITKDNINQYIKPLQEMGNLIRELTFADYATCSFVCRVIKEREAQEELERASRKKVLTDKEIASFLEDFADTCLRSASPKNLESIKLSKEEFIEKYHKARDILQRLFKEAENVYEVTKILKRDNVYLFRDEEYIHYLAFFKDFTLFMCWACQVHLD